MSENNYIEEIKNNAMQATSQEILDMYGITEYNADDIIKDFNDAMSFKQEQARIFKVLDAADHSDIWKIYNKKIPNYVQTPVNNCITIIKEATKASIMPTAYAGDFRPLSLQAKDLAEAANKFFQMKWESSDMDMVNNEAADYAYLHGTSGVLFGWNNDIVDDTDTLSATTLAKRTPFQAKAYHPSNIFPDPGAVTVDEMNYLFFSERKSKNYLRSIPRFAHAFALISNAYDSLGSTNDNYILDKAKQYQDDTVTFLVCYKKVLRSKVNPVTQAVALTPSVDIIYMAGKQILDISKDIQPARIPFVPLYDEKVPGNFWGTSKCYKVLSLQLTLNSLDSTEATAYFKHQNQPEFINQAAGLDIGQYQSKRDNPDKAFTVNCDPKNVQAYAQRPEIPKDLAVFRAYLMQQIQKVSGVDEAYLGGNYNSIQTTGGVSQAIDRATMRDNTRIKSIDMFIKRELELMVQFFIYHGKAEKFYAMGESNQVESGKEYDFNPADLIDREDISIWVSNCAPRSNASYEEAAMKLMELQMKYVPAEHGYPDFISPQELIGWMNIPKAQQNVLVERMNVQQENNKLEEYTAVLTAIGTLTQGGMPVEQALQEIAAQMVKTPLGQTPAAKPAQQANLPQEQ